MHPIILRLLADMMFLAAEDLELTCRPEHTPDCVVVLAESPGMNENSVQLKTSCDFNPKYRNHADKISQIRQNMVQLIHVIICPPQSDLRSLHSIQKKFTTFY